jgi:tRNA A-37 threonylcarbamoyl transferase component Bud32
MPLVLLPAFHQTRSFLALCAALVAAAIAGAHRLRVRGLERRQRELERLVEERTLELSRAQDEIEKLSGSESGILEDPAGWARALAHQIARAVGAREIGIWAVENGRVVPLAPGGTKAPEAAEIRSRTGSVSLVAGEAGDLLVPIVSATGEPRGALVVESGEMKGREVERRLLSAFAHHLGMAFELRRLNQRLGDAQARAVASARELRERGVEVARLCAECGRCYDSTAEICASDRLPLEETSRLPYRVQERYRLVRRLGEGGMGSVFVAHDERLSREVALKLINDENLRDVRMRLRFEREAHTLARIQHPNVIALHDSGELPDGTGFLVMELLQGRGLDRALLELGPASSRQAARLLTHAGGGLAAAHALGLVHRDVKPANLFLAERREGFQPKLLDFGLARPLRGDARVTQTGVVVGTPAYMSPEQVQGRELDVRSDLYSLAAVVYEVLTGRAVALETDQTSLLMEVLTGVPPRISQLLPGAPRALDIAFLSALAKEPDGRPDSVMEWVAEAVPLLEAFASERRGWPFEVV